MSVVSFARIGLPRSVEIEELLETGGDSESGGLITQEDPDCQLATSTKKSHDFVFPHAQGVQVSIREGALVSKSYEQNHARGLRTHTPRKR